MAVGAVCFVARLKKRRRNREMSDNAFHMALGGPSTGRNSKDSAIGSEMTVGGEKLNRTPVAQHAVIGAENVAVPGAEHPGRLSAMFRQSLGALGTYWGNNRHAHQNQDRQKQYYHQAGGAGGLWFNEDHNDLGYRDSAMTAAEAMHHPVSYRNDSTWSAVPLGIQQEHEQTSHIASGQPTVDQHYGNQHPRLKQQQSAPSIGQVAAAEVVGARSNSLSSASQISSQALRISGDTFGNSGATAVASSMPTSPLMVRPMSGGSLIGQEETRSRTSQYFPPPPDRYVDSRRESQDRGGGIGRGEVSSSSGQATDRIIIMVDPNQLESNALFEHVRKGPQGLPGSVISPPTSPVVQLRREAEASVDVAAGLERRQALEADIKALEVGYAATLATQASEARGTEIQGLTDILEPVEESTAEEEAEDEHLRNEDVDAEESDSLVTARETQDHSDIDSDEESAGTSNGYDILQGFDDDH
ncbi:hypothetical protein BGZ98_010183 [Dissophora globulifera]|nr:hypothetical protein BGZ98_010183 [Dissophora globulifera]